MLEQVMILVQKFLQRFLRGHHNSLLCPLILPKDGQLGRRSGLHIGCWEEFKGELIEEKQA